MPKSCFVVMPIGESESAEHRHFRVLYEEIAPVLRQRGYDVKRVDDIHRGGAITKDIVLSLGQSDLVIADLTNVNPNVMYELGVRHALRGKGTILVFDKDKSKVQKVPFDVNSYRYIEYLGKLEGIGTFKRKLDECISQLESSHIADFKDSPVHDWFPTLPVNVILEASKSSSAPLRRTIKQLQTRVSQYEKAYGTEIHNQEDLAAPISRIDAAIYDAEEGIFPASLYEAAQAAFDRRNVANFLKVIRTIVARNVRVSPAQFVSLSKMAGLLTLNNVAKAILDHGVELFPREEQLAVARLQSLAHSDNPGEIKRSIVLISKYLNIRDEKGVINLKASSITQELDLTLVVVLLDAYHREGLDKEALEIARSLLDLFPNKCIVNRNYARALEKNGRLKEAMSFYRAAILVDDADDESAVWLGNQLHNCGRSREAAEAYALACILDPSDADNFSQLMEELAVCHLKQMDLGIEERIDDDANKIYNLDIVLMAFRCATSCRVIGDATLARLNRTVRKLEIEQPGQQDERLTRDERLKIARNVFASIRSDLTRSGTDYKFDFAEGGNGFGTSTDSGKVG